MNSPFILKSRFIQELSHASNKISYIGEREGTVLDEEDNIQLFKTQDGMYLRRKSDMQGLELKGDLAHFETLEEVFEQEGHLYGVMAQDIREYVQYHQERPGSNGLFNEVSTKLDMDKEKDRLYDHMVHDGAFTWDWVLSLKEDDHDALGMNKKKWQQVINKVMPTIEKDMKVKLHWYGAYHYKEGHPHVHLLFYDPSRKIKKACLPQKKINQFKALFLNQFNYEEKKEIYKEKEQALKRIIANFKATPEEIKLLKNKLEARGNFRYGYLSPNDKKVVDYIVAHKCREGSINKELTEYNRQQERLIKLYDHNWDSVASKVRENYEKKVHVKLCNQLLKELKEEVVKDYEAFKSKKKKLANIHSVDQVLRGNSKNSADREGNLEKQKIEQLRRRQWMEYV